MASAVVRRINGHGRETGSAQLFIERQPDGIVLLKLGMLRVLIPGITWATLLREAGAELLVVDLDDEDSVSATEREIILAEQANLRERIVRLEELAGITDMNPNGSPG